MRKETLLEVVKDYLDRPGAGSLIVDIDELSVDWTPDSDAINHGPFQVVESNGSNEKCECGEYYNDGCEQCTNVAQYIFEKVLTVIEQSSNVENIEGVTWCIYNAIAYKVDDVSGVEYFNNVDEMLEKYEMTLDELLDKSYGIADDASVLNNPFVVYDYNSSEFTYLTKFDYDSVQQFIDELLAP